MWQRASFPTLTPSCLMAMAPRRPPSSCSTAARRLCNIIEQPLWFPSDSGGLAATSTAAWYLIYDLLVKEPQKRIAFTRGATTFFLFSKIDLWLSAGNSRYHK
jgi:hypothetical protein